LERKSSTGRPTTVAAQRETLELVVRHLLEDVAAPSPLTVVEPLDWANGVGAVKVAETGRT
jgi:hypothetical protein